MQENALQTMEQRAVVNFEDYAMSAENLKRQISIIQQVMRDVMHDGEHYGKIPGCGDKPTLLKPGAEKLSTTFRLAPSYKITKSDLGKGHREYEVVCTLTHISTGMTIGQGVGSCSTMEGKYRYRTGEVKPTGKPVPAKYWQGRDQKLIGGKGFSVKKIDGKWEVVEAGEKVEHENPADYYNTVLKMAKKRAHVDAVLTATAASDIFTQDIEDMAEALNGDAPKTPKKQNTEPPAKPPPKKEAGNGGCTKAQYNKIFALAKNHWPEESQKFVESSVKYLGSWFRSGEKLSKDEAGQIIEYFHILIPVSQSWPQISPQKAIEKCRELLEFWKPGEKVPEKEMLQIAQNWDDFMNQYQFEQQEAVIEGENQDENPFE